MAGIYIHIPFCKSRCTYCAFYSTVRLCNRARYVAALCREMEQRRQELTEQIDTVYIGGGTPSQLTEEQLRQLLIYINKVCEEVGTSTGGAAADRKAREVTVECNPDDVTDELAMLLHETGVNRVSMGVQTFDDERLRQIGRRHTARQAAVAVERLRAAGIGNVSIDLMYGLPEESLAQWTDDVEAALALSPEHLSAYCLTYEEGTPLYDRLQKGEVSETDEETERDMYSVLIDRLTAAGYEHYEISNFARPGYRSRHNNGYWTGAKYVGLGAGAHSFDGRGRQWNVADIDRYMEAVEHGQPDTEREELEGATRYNDVVTVALRTREGIDTALLPTIYRNHFVRSAQPFIDRGLLVREGDRYRLSREGLFVSDMIMRECLWV